MIRPVCTFMVLAFNKLPGGSRVRSLLQATLAGTASLWRLSNRASDTNAAHGHLEADKWTNRRAGRVPEVTHGVTPTSMLADLLPTQGAASTEVTRRGRSPSPCLGHLCRVQSRAPDRRAETKSIPCCGRLPCQLRSISEWQEIHLRVASRSRAQAGQCD